MTGPLPQPLKSPTPVPCSLTQGCRALSDLQRASLGAADSLSPGVWPRARGEEQEGLEVGAMGP